MTVKRAPLAALTITLCSGLAWLSLGSGPSIERPDITTGAPMEAGADPQGVATPPDRQVEVAERQVIEKQVDEQALAPSQDRAAASEAPRAPASPAEVARLKQELPDILAELGTTYDWDDMTRIELEVVLEAAITQGQALKVDKEAGVLEGEALRSAVEGLKTRTSDELSRILTDDERNVLMARIQGQLTPER